MILSDNVTAIDYTLHQLFLRIGIELEQQPLKISYGNIPVASETPHIIVKACSPNSWRDLLQQPPSSLRWLPTHHLIPIGAKLPFRDPIHVLFCRKAAQNKIDHFAELLANNTLLLHIDIIATAFFMLTRWEETIVPDRDEHGRFPATASVAYKQGFLDRPIVDEYALILREWIKVLLPGWQPEQRSFSVKLSHDIDRIARFESIPSALRKFGSDLIKHHNLNRAWRTTRDALAQAVMPAQTDYVRGIYRLADLSCETSLGNDAFYFMANGPDTSGCGYDSSSPIIRKCIEDLQEFGFEIGFHPSYDTFQDLSRLADEKACMDTVLGIGKTRYGGRQHFLRFQVPDTWRMWEALGLSYDSTMTYAGYEGFRCGTCHPFRPFDIEQNREFDLWELPLIVMDQTLRLYRGLTPEQGEKRIIELAQRCKHVEGTFTLLWHNTSLHEPWHLWDEAYRRSIEVLSKMQEVSA